MKCRMILAILVVFAVSAPVFASFAGTDMFLPSVGAKPGIGPSVWYTTIWVHNPGASAADVTFYLLERQQNLNPLTFTASIPAGDTRMFENAVQTMFNKQTFGALRVTSNAKVVVGSRIYSQSGELKDSVGQYFAGVPASFAIGLGQSTELFGVSSTVPVGDSAFRYNFGFVETTGTGTCTVKVTVKGQPGPKTYTVLQWEQAQKAFSTEFPISTGDTSLIVEVVSGTGRVIAFGSQVANGSQDPTTFEMAYRGELLAENAPGGTITGVTAGAGLTGGGTTGTVVLDVGAGAGINVASNTVGIAPAGVSNAMLADDAVTSTKIANAAVLTSHISTSGGSTNQVLTVTGSGAKWQNAAGGFTLPYVGQGSTAVNTELFYLRNTGNGRAMQLVSGSDTGLWVNSASGVAIDGRSTSNDAIIGIAGGSGRSGVIGRNSQTTGTSYGVYGQGPIGVRGAISGTTGIGVEGWGGNRGTGVSGRSSTGVQGESTTADGAGVYGIANNGVASYGVWGTSTNAWAGYFSGKVHVNGAFSATSKAFKIDHPLDPSGKYLYHSNVESSDMKNIYDGNVVTDDQGFATVTLPEWFEALNRDFRYQLTVLGGGDVWAQARVARKITASAFVIQTSAPNTEVSWQVTGIRQDAYANAHRIRVEEEKSGIEHGTYLHPELFGQPEEKSIEWATHPEQMSQAKAAREQEAQQPR